MRGTTMTLVGAMMTVAASAAAQESGAAAAPSVPVVAQPSAAASEAQPPRGPAPAQEAAAPRVADLHWPGDLPTSSRHMQSPAALAFGIVFCVAGLGGSIASLAVAGSVDKSGPMGGLNGLPYMGLGMLSLVVGAGVGIPLIVVGAKRETSSSALAPTRLDVGLGKVGASWAF